MTDISHLLTTEHRRAGLTLEEDEDFTYLKQAKTIATFHARNVTIGEMWAAADQVLNQSKSGIEIAKV